MPARSELEPEHLGRLIGLGELILRKVHTAPASDSATRRYERIGLQYSRRLGSFQIMPSDVQPALHLAMVRSGELCAARGRFLLYLRPLKASTITSKSHAYSVSALTSRTTRLGLLPELY